MTYKEDIETILMIPLFPRINSIIWHPGGSARYLVLDYNSFDGSFRMMSINSEITGWGHLSSFGWKYYSLGIEE